MRILVIDRPKQGVTPADYAPHLIDEIRHGLALSKQDIIREIYARHDHPGVVMIVEAESAEKAKAVCDEFPLVKAGLIDFEYIPFGAYTFTEHLFADQYK